MPLSPGTRLGPYEIVSSIGAGGMGEVYRAHDTKLGRDVAIKVLPEAFANDAERMARFEREAQVLASLNHPNIAAIYELEESTDVRALVMEVVEGPTMAERIGGRAMSLADVLPIAKQIAEGLEYAHEKGVVHRDLKPANIKITSEGTVKLLDFGLAKAVEEPAIVGNPSVSPTQTIHGTRVGVILGTAAYMAPEQARGAAVDKRADIWAYGVLLYEMLTGKRLFAGETVSDTLAAVLKTEPDFDAIPTRIRPLVQRCLEKDAKQRLRDIGDARIALNEPSTPETETALHLRSTRVMSWSVAGVAVAVSLVLGAALWRNTQSSDPPLIRMKVELGPEAVPFTGFGASAIISPDGKRLVYTGRGIDDKLLLYTRQLDREHAEVLPGTENPESPFFSPDGRWIGFFAAGKLKKISVLGGGAVVLCDALGGRGGSWGEDGNIIAALDFNLGLSRVPSGGGVEGPVTVLKRDARHRWPQLLPGANAVLFTAHTTNIGYDEATIEVQSVQTDDRKMLIRGGYYGRYVASGHLLYVHQGTLYAAPMDVNRLALTGPAVPVVEEVVCSPANGGAQVDCSRSGTLIYMKGKPVKQTLVWLDSTSHMQPLRATPTQYSGSPRFSPDGKRLALSVVEEGNTDVWAYELQRDTMTRLTSTPGFNAWPLWSHDGKHIVFSSARHGGAANLYWIRADGAGGAVRLTESKNVQVATSFSHDGKRLVFHESSPLNLWTVLLEGVESDTPKVGKPEPLLQISFGQKVGGKVSPDGRWLAYSSNESGRMEVYVQRFPSPGEKQQISSGGGTSPVWSTKGLELFYQTGGSIMVASYKASSEAFEGDKPKLWAETSNLYAFELAPDGKRFVVVQTEASEQKTPAHVTLMLNFFDELRRRAPPAGK